MSNLTPTEAIDLEEKMRKALRVCQEVLDDAGAEEYIISAKNKEFIGAQCSLSILTWLSIQVCITNTLLQKYGIDNKEL